MSNRSDPSQNSPEIADNTLQKAMILKPFKRITNQIAPRRQTHIQNVPMVKKILAAFM